MAGGLTKVVGPISVVTLEDGREMQLVVSRSGALGVVPVTDETVAATYDQAPSPQPTRPPTLREMGIDQG